MKRVPEPELMDDQVQAKAYAQADFNETDGMFVERFIDRFPGPMKGHALDLGCGPGNVALRLARAYPDLVVHAVDGAAAMLHCAEEALREAPDVRDRVHLVKGFIPDAPMPRDHYHAVVSNSLLHHLPDPSALWTTILRYARPGAPVQVMDLMRPHDEDEARELQAKYTEGAPEVLRTDFYHSLLAAFEPDEIREQLAAAGIEGWQVEVVTDRHVMVAGRAS